MSEFRNDEALRSTDVGPDPDPNRSGTLSRRNVLRAAGVATAAGTVGVGAALHSAEAHATPAGTSNPPECLADLTGSPADRTERN